MIIGFYCLSKQIKEKMWPIAEPPLAFIMKNVGGGFLNEGKETISPQRLKGDRDICLIN